MNRFRVLAAIAPTAAAIVLTVTTSASGLRAQPAAVTPRAAMSDPALSPDGRELAFIAGGDVWTVPVAGGDARLMIAHPATESRPLWSPDGTRIAFTSTRTGNGDIYVLDIASGRLSRRTFDDSKDQLDSWSRDGQWLYFSTSASDISGMNDVWRVPAKGGQPTAVAADRYASEYWGAPSPDGTTLAITARGTVSGQWWRHGHSHLDESEIWLVKGLDGDTPKYEPFGAQGGGKDAWPMWSPDGKTVYYMSDRNGQENLYAQTVGQSTTRMLTKFSDGRVLWPQIAYDGSAIVFERNYGIWKYDIKSGTSSAVNITLRGLSADVAAERQIATQGFSALALSPDARKATFTARGDVYVVGTRDGGDAARLTATVNVDADPLWFPDSRRVLYATMRGTSWNLMVSDVAARTEKALTTGVARNYGPRISPDGKWVAYQRDGNEVRVVSSEGLEDRRVALADVSEPPFGGAGTIVWSPDSRYIAYSARSPGGWGNVFVAALDGTAPHQVSFGADGNVGGVQWSPDGKYLLYRSSQRTETPRIIRIDLVPHTPRFREDQFRDLFGPNVLPPTVAPPATTPTAPRDTTRTATPDSARGGAATLRAAKPNVTIVYDGIRQRSSVLNTQGLEVGALTISPDGRTLAFTAVAGGQQQIYTMTLDELARDQQLRPITTTPGGKNSVQWSPDSRELWYLEGGRISVTVVDSRTTRSVAATAETDVSFEAEKRAVFDQARSYLANNLFDASMRGVDWTALASRVSPFVEGSRNPDDLRRVISLMIGELNASHSGISGATTGGVVVPMARVGVRVDRAMLERSARYRVSEVIAQGPAAVAGIVVGDVISAVDGVPLSANQPFDSLLLGKVGKRVVLTVATGTALPRDIALPAIALGAEKQLLYRQWVEERRAYVAKISNGRLGYVHMFDMGQGSLDQLYLDLDAENQARDGVVVDVRNNNGGFVNAYAIDVLTRRSYLLFTQRGSTVTPARGSLGQRTLEKPTVLVVNQHTLSDGEDFTEGYRANGLGKVVGEATAGWIVFTSNVNLLDGSSLRIPFTRVTDAKGQDMELKPRAVDVPVVRPVGESYSGKDSQLDAAVASLLVGLPKRN